MFIAMNSVAKHLTSKKKLKLNKLILNKYFTNLFSEVKFHLSEIPSHRCQEIIITETFKNTCAHC